MGAALPALDDSRLLLPVARDALIGSNVGPLLRLIGAEPAHTEAITTDKIAGAEVDLHTGIIDTSSRT